MLVSYREAETPLNGGEIRLRLRLTVRSTVVRIEILVNADQALSVKVSTISGAQAIVQYHTNLEMPLPNSHEPYLDRYSVEDTARIKIATRSSENHNDHYSKCLPPTNPTRSSRRH